MNSHRLNKKFRILGGGSCPSLQHPLDFLSFLFRCLTLVLLKGAFPRSPPFCYLMRHIFLMEKEIDWITISYRGGKNAGFLSYVKTEICKE